MSYLNCMMKKSGKTGRLNLDPNLGEDQQTTVVAKSVLLAFNFSFPANEILLALPLRQPVEACEAVSTQAITRGLTGTSSPGTSHETNTLQMRLKDLLFFFF